MSNETTPLYLKIAAALAAKFEAKLKAEQQKKTAVIESLIADWCGCGVPRRRGRGRPPKAKT